MQVLSIQETQEVNGGVNAGAIAVGGALIGMGALAIATGGFALVAVGSISMAMGGTWAGVGFSIGN